MPAADSRFRRLLDETPLIFAGGSTIAILIGIAPSQILLGAAIAALLATRTRWRLPPVWVPLALFLAGTLISMAFSGDPAAGQRSQQQHAQCETAAVNFGFFDAVRNRESAAGIGAIHHDSGCYNLCGS